MLFFIKERVANILGSVGYYNRIIPLVRRTPYFEMKEFCVQPIKTLYKESQLV